MVWAILMFLGVPLWLCVGGIALEVWNNRKLRKRAGNIPVRVLRPGKKHWIRGHAIWVSDVFAWRASPAGWNEAVLQIEDASAREPSPDEQHKLRRFSDELTIVTLDSGDNEPLDVAAPADARERLLGPFARVDEPAAVTEPA